jgi:hypothetical protein
VPGTRASGTLGAYPLVNGMEGRVGARDPGDDRFVGLSLSEMRRRVVEPVVRSLVRADELNDVQLAWWRSSAYGMSSPWRDDHQDFLHVARHAPGPLADLYREGDLLGPELWIRVSARGEVFESQMWGTGSADDEATLAEVAWDLASRLEDWVCETAFGWGEQRTAEYTIPPAAPRAVTTAVNRARPGRVPAGARTSRRRAPRRSRRTAHPRPAGTRAPRTPRP